MYYVIGKDSCQWCDKAKAKLDKPGNTPYVYKNLSLLSKTKREQWKDFIQNELNISTVPVIIKVVGGYNELLEELEDD
jgi:glutaredoxin